MKQQKLKERLWHTKSEIRLLEMEHTGWVDYVSYDFFRLKRSKFEPFFITPHFYKVPRDIRPYQDSLIEVIVGGLFKDIKNVNLRSGLGDYRKWYEVENIKEVNLSVLEMPKPYLRNEEEFLTRISHYWSDADYDMLDFSLALQILSCPESIYGIGGIGTQSFSMQGKKPLDNLKKTILQILPSDFTRHNEKYEYKFIMNTKNHSGVELRRRSRIVPEVSYNYLYSLPEYHGSLLPIQIPTIINDANYSNRKKEPDIDIMEFLLHALMINPPIREEIYRKIDGSIKKVYEEIHPENDGTYAPFDTYSLVKVANGFCRLNLIEELSENVFEASTYKFERLYKEFLESKEDFKKIGGERTWAVPASHVSYLEAKLTSKDMKIYRIIRKISEEEGKQYVTFDDIMNNKEYELKRKDIVFKNLEKLVNVGYITFHKGWNEFRILDYWKDKTT